MEDRFVSIGDIIQDKNATDHVVGWPWPAADTHPAPAYFPLLVDGNKKDVEG